MTTSRFKESILHAESPHSPYSSPSQTESRIAEETESNYDRSQLCVVHGACYGPHGSGLLVVVTLTLRSVLSSFLGRALNSTTLQVTSAKLLEDGSQDSYAKPVLANGRRRSSTSGNGSDRSVPVVTSDSPSYIVTSPGTRPKQLDQALLAAAPKPRLPQTDSSSQPNQLDDTSSEYVRIASECLHAQDYPKMVQTLMHLQHGESPTVVAAYEFGSGVGFFKLKKYTAAIRHFTRLEQLAAQQPEGTGNVSVAYYYLGEIDFTRAKFQEAAGHYDRAVSSYGPSSVADLFRMVTPSLSGLYSKQAASLRNASKVMAAVQAYKNAIATAESKKDKLSAHTSLGNLYQSVGENSSALKEYEQSIRLSEELEDNISLGWAHGNMGNAYLSLYQREKALFHLDKSLELAIQHEPTPQAIGRAYNNLGTAHQALSELDKAQSYYDLALSQGIYGNDTPGQARVYGNIGNLLMVQKKYDSAIAHYTETLSISNDRSTCSTAYHNRGCARYEKAESDRARLAQRSSSDPDGYEICFCGPRFSNIELTYQPVILTESIRKQYRHASQDLVKVVQYHEETFQTIKGSAKGLTLSVSLFESNSRTFHRLQDSLCCLEKWQEALVYAEQSRSRALGELMLQKKSPQLPMPLNAPLTFEQIVKVVKSQENDVIFLSYTGARLLVWVLAPEGDSISINMFQVSLRDDQFEGKSLDHYLRYSLTELLIEKNVEMYAFCNYEDESPVTRLHKLLAEPLLKVFDALGGPEDGQKVRDIVLIPDSYTNLMPLVALLDTSSQQFLGDRFRFRIMPSLLTMGIMNQLPPIVVNIPEDSHNFCVVGNPTIPTFSHHGETWNLGKLPFAAEEAEWVSHILKCSPTLHEQATKAIVLMMIAKGKIVHLATHGSAAAGFLAFAGLGSSRNGNPVDESKILVYPDDIERMSISPALVVLSSCDSGRGTVKADGILGMARAFILAGAQAVLTTLWRVPDESACFFMQFLYQYLMDGLRGSEALQKAILSLRCFSKYSAFIHWSGYQLTGREIQFRVETSPKDRIVGGHIGRSAVFPRLDVVKKLENAFVKATNFPTDMQVIQGSHGLKPSEPVIDFISKNHTHFPGGVFWLHGSSPDLTSAAAQCIRKVQPLSSVDSDSTPRPKLVILENIKVLPDSETVLQLLKDHDTHIIVTTNLSTPVDGLKKEADHNLLRGCTTTQVKPLSVLHVTQRIVYSILRTTHFTPSNRDQNILCQIAERTCGSPDVVDMVSALLQKCINNCESGDFLEEFTTRTNFTSKRELIPPPRDTTTTAEEEDPYADTISEITVFTSSLISGFQLPSASYFLLRLLSCFGSAPLPRALVETAQSLVVAAMVRKSSQGTNPLANLVSARLLRIYPAAVVVPPGGVVCLGGTDLEPSFFYVPQLVCDALTSHMEERDRVFSITSAYKALLQFSMVPATDATSCGLHFAAGLAKVLLELCDSQLNLPCYQELYRLYIICQSKLSAITKA